jgi:hypothetical protein
MVLLKQGNIFIYGHYRRSEAFFREVINLTTEFIHQEFINLQGYDFSMI